MSKINFVRNPADIGSYLNWADSKKFISKDRIVGENGKVVPQGYRDNQYKLISKKERDFSASEKMGRGILGVAVVICTLGIAILFKSARKFFTQTKEKIRFALIVDGTSRSNLSPPIPVNPHFKLLQNNREGSILLSLNGIHR